MMNGALFLSLRNRAFIVQFSLAVFTLSSCKYFKKEKDDTVVARVYDKYLYANDLKEMLPDGLSKEDSTHLANNYINNWVKQGLLIKKAELNLPEEKKGVEQKLEDYRNSLILYLYQEELIKQRLNTMISEDEVIAYYEENKQNFELKENIVRVLYVKLDKQNKSVNKIKKWMNEGDTESKNRLAEYCSTQALRFQLDDTRWFTPEELAKETGIAQNKIEQMSRYSNVYELDQNDGYFIIKTLEYQLKNDISPLSFEEENIRNIILNKRKLKLIEDLEKDVMKEGVAKNNFEIYNAKK